MNMKKSKKLVDRRKHKRFKVPADAFAIVKNPCFKLGQIADMSLGGISFYYISGKGFSKNIAVDILLADDDLYIDNLPVSIVSDVNVHLNESLDKTSFKRCGLQFEKLTSHQLSKLSCFIPKQDSGYLQDKRFILF
ncbi:MAG: PilZ domain-containing protein [Desulfobacteraceae bacterium]|nr:MAG: PilZ domain-containing protein [Desulfobacteraceae bacterium]